MKNRIAKEESKKREDEEVPESSVATKKPKNSRKKSGGSSKSAPIDVDATQIPGAREDDLQIIDSQKAPCIEINTRENVNESSGRHISKANVAGMVDQSMASGDESSNDDQVLIAKALQKKTSKSKKAAKKAKKAEASEKVKKAEVSGKKKKKTSKATTSKPTKVSVPASSPKVAEASSTPQVAETATVREVAEIATIPKVVGETTTQMDVEAPSSKVADETSNLPTFKQVEDGLRDGDIVLEDSDIASTLTVGTKKDVEGSYSASSSRSRSPQLEQPSNSLMSVGEMLLEFHTELPNLQGEVNHVLLQVAQLNERDQLEPSTRGDQIGEAMEEQGKY